MLTDAHCHPADLALRMSSAEDERRRLAVACAASATTLAEFEFCERLSREAACAGTAPLLPCFAAHPQLPRYRAGGRRGEAVDLAECIDTLETLAGENRLAAVGETGFDLYGAAFRETEKEQDFLFAAHLETALRNGLPLVIHARRSMHKIFARAAALKKCRAVIFHSWPGTMVEGESLLRRGINAFFSFGAIVALNHREAMRCCALFPANRLLAETDAPYQPLRGKGFSSHADLPIIMEAIAALRRKAGSEGASATCLEKIVERNFHAAFGAERAASGIGAVIGAGSAAGSIT